MRGPLGNGFPIMDWMGKDLVVIGVDALFLALCVTQHVMHTDNRKDYGRIVVIYGARSSGLCLYQPDIKSWYERPDIEIHQAIDVPEEAGITIRVLCRMWSKSCASPRIRLQWYAAHRSDEIHSPILVDLGFAPQNIFTPWRNDEVRGWKMRALQSGTKVHLQRRTSILSGGDE